MDTTVLLLLLVAVASLGFLTFFVSASVAFSHLREERVERLIQRRVPGARRLAALTNSREPLEMALLIVRATATATFAIAGYALVFRLAPTTWVGVPLGLIVATGGVILAQAAGGVWAGANPEKAAIALTPIGAAS